MQREQPDELPSADAGVPAGEVDREPALPDAEPHPEPLAHGNAITNSHWFRHADGHGITFSFGYSVRFPDPISHADAERHADAVSASVGRWMRDLRDSAGGRTASGDPARHAYAEPHPDA